MLFNSLSFAVFLPIVFILYWALPHKFRWLVVLVSSYYFYMSWNVKYVFLILLTTFVSYLCGILVSRTDSQKQKKVYLTATLVICLGVLVVFKYFNFFSDSIVTLLQSLSIPVHPVTLSLMLPVGISFYTFQTLSYVIDVYRGDVEAERHFGHYAAFISFFPQLVAGPIERTKNLLPQIKAKHTFSYDQAVYGLKLMGWGFFKKLLISDTLSPYVDRVYGDLGAYTGFPIVVATIFFAFQIYCDFSGYSDIAIGVAKLFGIELMTNFKSPYFSTSIKEFWSRWHISLSTWFKDYVYIPLGGNRVSKVRHKINLILTFLISGLWHGANWTFIVWGGIHGAGQVVENIFAKKPTPDKKPNPIVQALKMLLVFAFCCFAWVFFRADNIGDAFFALGNMFSGIGNPLHYIASGLEAIDIGKFWTAYLGFFILIFLIIDGLNKNKDIIAKFDKKPLIPRAAVYVMFIVLMIIFSKKGAPAEFIYFQF